MNFVLRVKVHNKGIHSWHWKWARIFWVLAMKIVMQGGWGAQGKHESTI